ncbi:hypothetical protein JCGZ_04276 [Jatropha curcas]|uniref:Zinc finger PHD-type domain-containing protein n=1 Tax=Jatropha curcas TaxID=180498 RepID=A0A067KQ65_JATCU|nr:hypothetical protein JCGZ_04276 [Jatropha curcas]
MEELKPQVPFIVAIKDHPGSIGSRKISHELAEFVRCPLINENDITQTLEKISIPTPSSSTITQTSNELSDNLPFEIVSQIALTQLNLKFNVIINILLFNDTRLNKLIELEHSGKARLIIIQGESNNHQDYYDSGHILKVSIEKESFNVNEVVTKMYNLLDGMRENAKSHNKLIRQPINDHLHELVLSKEPRTNKILCRSCSKLISGLSYECAECNEFTFHKLCAESSPDVKNCPRWLRKMKPKQYDFQKTYKCNNCAEFSEDCYDCLFQTNVKHGFLPTILHQQRHQHFLNFIIMPFQYNYQYKCCICDKLGSSVSYKCYDCNYDVHVKCILPSTTWMRGNDYSLVSASSYHQDELEKYNCDICHEKIEASQLLYWCEEQDFIHAGKIKYFTDQNKNLPIHVKCMPSVIEEESIDREAIEFIKMEHKNFELSKWKTFKLH